MNYAEESLKKHKEWQGKIEVICRAPLETRDDLSLAYVPGAFEIPLVALKMAESGKFDAVVCLGAVIRGATPHFDMVAGESAKGIASASLRSGVPVTNGILTTDSIEQAIERAGTKAGNKGADAMLSAIEMINVMKGL